MKKQEGDAASTKNTKKHYAQNWANQNSCKSICWLTERPRLIHSRSVIFVTNSGKKKRLHTRSAHISTYFFLFLSPLSAFNYEISYEAKEKENRMRIRVNFGVELAFEVAFLAMVFHVTFFLLLLQHISCALRTVVNLIGRLGAHYHQLQSRHMHTLFVLHTNSNVV